MKIVTTIFVIIAVILSFFAGKRYSKTEFVERIVYDTVVHTNVTYKYIDKIKPLVISLPVIYTETDTFRTKDSVLVEVPMYKYHFEDSTFKADISGFNVKLDRISVFPKTIYNTKIENKKTRWGIGIQVGYGITIKDIRPYFGVGIQYNILSW
jgi:hypothetical protein